MGVEGVTFAEAWKRRVETTYGGTRIWVVGLDDLIRMKRATGRPQDLIDAENLERARGRGS